jgi:hypothetical protein
MQLSGERRRSSVWSKLTPSPGSSPESGGRRSSILSFFKKGGDDHESHENAVDMAEEK